MRRFCWLLALTLLLGMLPGCGGTGGVTVYDAEGNRLATVSQMDFSPQELTDPGYDDYVCLALTEAVSALTEQRGITESRARRVLFSGGYEIHTAFSPAVYAALEAAYATAEEGLAFGGAVTDLEGALCAVYSGGGAGNGITPRSPHSSIKPLSVYGPAMDAGVIHWGTRLTDDPYTQTVGESGRLNNWPSNATGSYSYQPERLTDCIRYSLNTTAVHCLHEYGVARSVDFLESRFGIDLTAEKERMQAADEDEIIGNIALGSLVAGVSPVDMAGYYQIFVNYGMYQRPYTVTAIRRADGEAVYTYSGVAQQVLQPTTARIMNYLLQAVVQRGGTGADAFSKEVEVAGKTGTGDRFEDNWFVGVTPQYSCAVWHGEGVQENRAAELFAQVLEHLPTHTQTTFPDCERVHKGYFCKETGLLFTQSCSKIEVGYYASTQPPEVCDGH